ncbi:hypothetical protein K0651_12445 [Ornithinimicrobium sp. Arc0846-15]|nr:hypothetical protein [Ornithinimicrobium laminariae]
MAEPHLMWGSGTKLHGCPCVSQADVTVSTVGYWVQGDGSVGVRNTAIRGDETDATAGGLAVPAEGAQETDNRLIAATTPSSDLRTTTR